MKTLMTKQTAINQAVVSSLTSNTSSLKRKSPNRLLIQVLPALAVVGLFAPSAAWAADYNFNDNGGTGYVIDGKLWNDAAGTSGSGTAVTSDDIVAGYYYDDSTAVSGGNITVSGSTAAESIVGGYSYEGSVSGNTVTLDNATVTTDSEGSISGGYSDGDVSISNNKVVMSGGSVTGDVYGGYLESNADDDDTAGSGTSDVTGNTVEISNGATVTGIVAGGRNYGNGGVSGNTATVNGATVYGSVAGGYAEGSGTISGNTVTITNSTVSSADQFTAGGISDEGNVTGNTLNISNSTIEGRVYAGYSESGSVTNNTVTISGSSMDLGNAYLYGYNGSSGSGNTLNLSGFSGGVGNIEKFDNINIDLAGVTLSSDTPVIALTASSTDLSNTNITITSSSGAVTTSGALADKYTIIYSISDLTLTGATASGTITIMQDSALYADYSLYVDEYSNTVLAVAPNYFAGAGDGDGIGVKTTPAVNILPEQHLAVASFLNTATDFALDRKIDCSANEDGSVGTCFFGAVSGGQLRQKLHGSSASTREDGTHFFIGVQTKFNNDTSKDIIGAIWAEAGWGTVKATNSYAGSRGHDSYYGLGIRGEHRQKEGALAGAYAQVFAHAGTAGYDIKTTLRSGDSRLSYDKNSMYVGAGIQLGYEYPFNESLSLDTSVKYRWLHLEGFKTTSNSLRYKVKDVESHRTRLGTRINYGKDKAVSNVYAGIAWEQEYSGRAKGSVDGISMTGTNSLKGSSAVIEAGVKFKPSKKSRWSFDGSVEGYVGKREGVLGNLVVNYTF